MGIYTNTAGFGGYGSYSSPSYDTVEPFALSEHYNYHELGIVAATESAMNRDMFMQSIGIAEANALAQYGDENVFYESVNLGGIFQKIKMFFKKIIEKIQKIFHTFIAKMSSWFSSSKDFAKKYGKEITTKWGRIKNDLNFKGYKFKHIIKVKGSDNSTNTTAWKNSYTGDAKGAADTQTLKLSEFINAASDETKLVAMLKDTFGNVPSAGSSNADLGLEDKAKAKAIAEGISKFRSDKLDDFKDSVRKKIITALTGTDTKTINDIGQITFDLSATGGGYDQKEYTEELYKAFRSNEDSKEDLSKKDIEDVYGGSITNLLAYLTDYDKIKSNIEACQKAMTNAIDKFISAFDKAEKELVKGASDEGKGGNDQNKIKNKEALVAVSVLCQDILGFTKEAQIQAFGAALQAQKEACSQAKEICVMTIGQSKKVTEESYDYGNSSDFGSFANGLIENTVIR